MYPRNAASPERISIGAVVQISDGAVQTAGVTVRILPFGSSEADGVGTVAYSTDGIVLYTPTQGETNYTSFVLIAKKTGCIPANVTVITSESTVSGRVYVATNGDKTGYTATVSDKTGFSLLAGTGLGDQNGSVASVNLVEELGANALSANGAIDEIADIQVLSRLDSMIESDGSGQFRFDTIAVSMVAGGAGGTDWTANERTAIRAILGVPTSGTTPTDPTSGILDEIRDKTALITAGGTVNVSTPVTATGQLASPLIIGDDYLAANGRRFRWTVELPTGYVIATSTARFGMRYEDDEGVNEFIATGTVTDATGGNVHLDFDVAKTVTGTLRPGWYEWSVEIVSATGVEITRVKSGKNAEWQGKQT
jgi:hypothetical protein